MSVLLAHIRAASICIALCSVGAESTGRLKVKSGSNGTFSILVDGNEWFAGAPPSFHHEGRLLSVQDGSLELKAAHGQEQLWTPRGLDTPTFKTEVKVFEGYVVFTQSFPDGATGTSTGDRDNLISAYPALTPKWQSPKGVVSFQGDMTGSGTTAGRWNAKSGLWHTGDSMDSCRIVTGVFTLENSGAGYSAWTSKSGGGFQSRPGQFCGNGKGTHAPSAFHSKLLNQTACEAKCASLSCVCFDHKAQGPAPSVIGQGISGTGPVVVFDQDLKTSLVLSPFSNFMAANQKVVGGALSYGVMGAVTSIPKGFSLATVITLGTGVNAAMDAWGDVLLKQYGKERYAYQKDLAMQYLGYSTDNGAYYYYQTEPNKNYEDTLIDVLAYAKEKSIPYKYVLLDSWWYFKGKAGGVKTWEARPDIFPDGSAGFWNQTKWPTQLHNRMWAPDTTYAKQNGGKYNFIIDGSNVAVPDDQQFWNDLIGNKTTEAGAFMYEQDWLDIEFDQSKSIGENATLGRTWMLQMDRGAGYANQTIQMCMSHVRHILQSVEMPRVTNARASGDYHPGSGQWDTGRSAILAHAVGIAPSKDNYWSTPVQNGTHYGNNTRESHSRLEAAVSTLTNGPVAPSDKVGGSDAVLIMRCCDASGRLLSADRPATEIDAYFTQKAGFGGVQGHLWSTYSTVTGQRFSYAIGISLESVYNLTLAELGYEAGAQLLATKIDAKTVTTFSSKTPLAFEPLADEDDVQLYLIAPKTGSYTLLGEPDKWISVSSQRFSDLASSGGATSVQVHGQAGEHVQVRWASASGHITTASCLLSASGVAVSKMSASGASCTSTLEVVV